MSTSIRRLYDLENMYIIGEQFYIANSEKKCGYFSVFAIECGVFVYNANGKRLKKRITNCDLISSILNINYKDSPLVEKTDDIVEYFKMYSEWYITEKEAKKYSRLLKKAMNDSFFTVGLLNFLEKEFYNLKY